MNTSEFRSAEDANDDLPNIKTFVVDEGAKVALILAVPLAVAALTRAVSIGLQPSMIVGVLVVLLLAVLVFCRKRLGLNVRAAAVLFGSFAAATTSLLTHGISGAGECLFVAFIIMSGFFYGLWMGVAAAALTILLMAVSGLLADAGFIGLSNLSQSGLSVLGLYLTGPVFVVSVSALLPLLTFRAYQRALTKQRQNTNDIKSQLDANLRLLDEAQKMAKIGSWSVSLENPEDILRSDYLYALYEISRSPAAPPIADHDPFVERIHPEDIDRVKAYFEKVYVQKTAEEVRYRLQMPDGRVKLLINFAFPIFDKDGLVKTFSGYTQDITAQSLAEQNLADSERALREAEIVGRSGSWEQFFPSGAINRSEGFYRLYELSRISGESPDDETKRFVARIHPDDRSRVGAEFEEAKTREVSSLYRLVMDDGTIKRVKGFMTPHFDENGRLQKITGTRFDVTEISNLEAIREDLLAKLERVEKAAKIGGWRLDVKTHSVTWTPGNYVIHDLQPEDQQGFAFYSDRDTGALPPDTTVEEYRRAIAEKQPFVFTGERTLITGRKVWFRSRGEPIFEDGELIAYEGFAQDISEQVESENALRHAFAKLEEVQAAAKIGTVETDYRRDLVRNSAHSAAIFESKELVSTIEEARNRFLSLIHPEDRNVLKSPETFRSSVADASFRLQMPSGKIKYIRIRTLYERGESGDLLSSLAIIQDLTEIYEARFQLEEAQRMAKIGSYSIDLAARTFTASKEWPRILEINDVDVLDLAAAQDIFTARIAPEERERNLENRRQVLSADGAISDHRARRSEYRLAFPDGRTKYVRVRSEPVFDINGKLTGLLGTIKDITSAKTAEIELERAARQLQATLDATVEGIITIDSRGTMLRVNRAASEIFGYSADDMIGRNVSYLMPEPDRSRHDSYVAAYLRTGKRAVIGIGREVEGQRKNGSKFPLELSVAPIEDGQGALNFIGTIRDITIRKNTEEQLRRAQKMEAVGQLTAGIAHDFNNLLTVIVGNLEDLTEDIGHVPELGRNLDLAMSAAKRGAQLTQHLLAYGRKQTLSPTLVHVGRCVENFLHLVKRTFPADVEIKTVGISASTWASVDESQLENALLNLSVNARDAMPAGGRLTIATETVLIEEPRSVFGGALEPGRYAVISLQDTGNGMPADVLAKVFDPFYTTKPIGKGTGLGLSMVYGFVRQSGGHINIDSSPGLGTTVTIYFPSKDAPSRSAGEMAKMGNESAIGKAGIPVLLVDDIDSVRETVRGQLERLGYMVEVASDGVEALKLLEASRFNLLITDLGLPGEISGHVLAEKVSREWPMIKIVCITGYNEQSADPDGRLKPWINATLRKPFTRTELKEQLDRLNLGVAAD